jgi:hypothetical protein
MTLLRDQTWTRNFSKAKINHTECADRSPHLRHWVEVPVERRWGQNSLVQRLTIKARIMRSLASQYRP